VDDVRWEAMTVYEFPLETRQEVENGIAQHARLDKPRAPTTKAGEEDHRRIVRLTLLHRDAHGHEREIAEWDERDLYGEHVSIDSIVHGVELASCRDAAFQFGGECVYVLVFHGKDHPNRSRFFFKIFGGQEVQNMAMIMHGRERNGGEAGLAERLMPDLLRYVSEKEGRIDAKGELVFNTLVKQVQQLSGVVTEYTDRELKLREITLNAEDHIYERNKKHKEDEEEAKMKLKAWEMLNEHGPKVLPYVIRAIQRFSSGPGGKTEGSEFQAWMEEQARRAQEKASEAEKGNGKSQVRSNGKKASSAETRAEEVPDAEVEDATPQGEESKENGNGSGEPSLFDQLQLRVAFDTARFVSLCKTRKKFDALRESLSEEQLSIFDQIVTAAETSNLDEEEGVVHLAGLSLMFGASVQANPVVGVQMFGVLDGMCKMSLVELSNLLKMYHEAIEEQAKS
jgi:hypothetical protein